MPQRALATFPKDFKRLTILHSSFKQVLPMLFPKILMTISILAASARGDNWATYPAVPKTATINGFADPIKSLFPSCAADCADLSTNNTPCPYWDTGCLCIMPQWAGQVAGCIALSCSGSDVVSATSLAYSLCSKVGANLWMMPGSVSTALSKAAGTARDVNSLGISSSGATKTLSQPISASDFLGAGLSSASLASQTSSSSTAQIQTTNRPNGGALNLKTNFFLFLLFPIAVIVV